MRFMHQCNTVSANPLDYVVMTPRFLVGGMTFDYYWEVTELRSWLYTSDMQDDFREAFIAELKFTAARILDITPTAFQEV